MISSMNGVHFNTLNRFCAARYLLVSFSEQPFGFIDEALMLLGRERRMVITVNQFARVCGLSKRTQPSQSTHENSASL